MKHNISSISKVLLLGLLPLVTKAQDIHFSQFYETSILRNPSLTGIFASDYKLTATYRNQWSSISKPFQTAVVSGEFRKPMGNMGDFLSIGLLGYYDRAGSIDLQTISVYPAVNYNKILNEEHSTYLSVGFTGGYIQRSFNPDKATFNNQYIGDQYSASNPSGETLPNPKLNYWDMGAGVTYSGNTGMNNSTSYTIGAAGYHFTKPKTSFYNNAGISLDMRLNVNGSVTKQLNEIFSVQCHANYVNQGSYNELLAGGLVGWNKKDEGYTSGPILFAIYGGVFMRLNDALIPVVKVRYRDYNFAFSYDGNLSKLHIASNVRGGYELTISKMGLFSDPGEGKARTICPDH